MTTISDRQKILIIILFSAILIASSFYFYKAHIQQTGIIIEISEQKDINDGAQVENGDRDIVSAPIYDEIYVHVKGAVKNPGVYKLDTSNRVVDAVNAAGGPLADGNLDLINLAAKLTDGQEVIVYTSVEEQQAWNTLASIASASDSNNVNSMVNINTATQEQLQVLPGIGPSRAEAIIRYREQHGAFQSIESIINVSGIGQVTFENIKDSITIQ
ncbi:helix-hairpin-helix domain-containing protein [Desulfuribacillus alkaliarsenatis]|uniref:Helix-hairpin-helix DNA-binding motif class 1 domain-containing protein n=1 Tax=Desulfuribacillus alkaliarsenatis TaxID=766136 RepID=A0A1E5G0A6_9FIRM|nr:helix-hairpin-helix domain-containing protein [Desulfuribacillus alkaliarsenatis]OEF96252.1 hypothetical protein BHF68_08805 [Desulfuribacillus alkaliarsenatis]